MHRPVLAVALIEFADGILFALGIASRLVSLVLFVNMTMAYLCVPDDRINFTHILSNPNDFYGATPYTYWFAALLIMVLGPGLISVDTLIKRWLDRKYKARASALSSFHSIFFKGAGGMRIVYVLTSLGVGGAERQALAVADRMAHRGHEVSVLVLSPRLVDEWPTNLPTVCLNMRKTPVSVLSGLAQARHFLRGFRPDLLHSHSFHANIVARLLKLLVPSTKIVSTVHNVYEGGRMRMLAYRLTDVLASRTTAVSQAATDRFIRLKAIPRKKCLLLPNGIDLTEFTPSTERRKNTRTEMAGGESFIWLAAGRLVPAKDFPTLLRAFKQVRVANPNTQLWIAGAPAEGMLRKSVDGRSGSVSGFVVERDSMENVRLLGFRRDMPALFDAADAFVLSSAWEGMPLAVAEAMAMEKPVVATDAGGTRELIGDAGTIVPPKNADALAAAMLDLMQQSAEFRQTLGQSAHARITSHFSIETRANEWEALYQAIVEARH